jgi:hypothetical protein
MNEQENKQENKYTEYSKGNLIKWLDKLALKDGVASGETAQTVEDVKLLLDRYATNTVLSPAASYGDLYESYASADKYNDVAGRRLVFAVCTEIKTWSRYRVEERNNINEAVSKENEAVKKNSAAAKLFTGLIILISVVAIVSTALGLSHVINLGEEIAAAISCLGLVFGVTFFLYNKRNANSPSLPAEIKELLDKIDANDTAAATNVTIIYGDKNTTNTHIKGICNHVTNNDFKNNKKE